MSNTCRLRGLHRLLVVLVVVIVFVVILVPGTRCTTAIVIVIISVAILAPSSVYIKRFGTGSLVQKRPPAQDGWHFWSY